MIWMMLLLLFLGPKTPHKKHSQAHELKSGAGSGESIVPPATAINQTSSTVDNCQLKAASSSSSNRQHWWQIPEWDTLIVTVCYTVVSGFALVVIWNQNRSIQNTERAVLVPMWENMIHHNPDVQQGLSHCFMTNFINHGQTAGFIRGVFAEMKLLDSMDDLDKIPRYGRICPYQGDAIPAGKTTENPIYFPMDDKREFHEIEREYRHEGKTLYVFGFVRYEDIYGRSHDTRFGLRYRCKPHNEHQYDGFLIDGPPRYNKYT